jgi:predicted alpha/beta hydrolase family esterase
MTRTLLVPDPGGAPTNHWQIWWADVEPDAHVIHWANSMDVTQEAWASGIADAIPAEPDTFLVAHGEICAIVAHLLVSLAQPGVAGALFVAPTNLDRNNRHSKMSVPPGEELSVPTTVVASRTDPCTSIGEAERIAAGWGSKFIDLGDAGHIDAASGFGP